MAAWCDVRSGARDPCGSRPSTVLPSFGIVGRGPDGSIRIHSAKSKGARPYKSKKQKRQKPRDLSGGSLVMILFEQDVCRLPHHRAWSLFTRSYFVFNIFAGIRRPLHIFDSFFLRCCWFGVIVGSCLVSSPEFTISRRWINQVGEGVCRWLDNSDGPLACGMELQESSNVHHPWGSHHHGLCRRLLMSSLRSNHYGLLAVTKSLVVRQDFTTTGTGPSGATVALLGPPSRL